MKWNSFARFSWSVLAYNILVILWGAFVRATGSGAGCGSHWPLCNGVVVPRSPQIETVIEFTHRLSSGLALILVLILFFWAFRLYPKGHILRKGAAYSLIFIISEALVGAGLVLFSWVAHDASMGRVISMAVHLINTFLLLAALVLTSWWALGAEKPVLRGQGTLPWFFCAGFLLVLVLGVSGAITALGDTLFPAESLAEGLAQDFAPQSHFLLRLRVWHPLIAVLTGAYVVLLAWQVSKTRQGERLQRLAWLLSGLFVVQGLAGLLNLLLLAPVWMQIVHLLLADLVWMSLVLFAAESFAGVAVKPGEA